jgi:hypothetical protein
LSSDKIYTEARSTGICSTILFITILNKIYTSNGTIEPSDEWLQQATHVHKYFNKFHPEKGFDRGRNLVKRLTNLVMSKNAKYNKDPVGLYIRQSLFIIMKFLNTQLKLSRASQQTGSQKLSQAQKKMTKVICKKID